MKKNPLLFFVAPVSLALFLNNSAGAEQLQFNGPYMGAGLGWSQNSLSSSAVINADISSTLIVNTTQSKAFLGSYNSQFAVMRAGYNKTFNNNFLCGFEIRLGMHPAKNINGTMTSRALVSGSEVTRQILDLSFKASSLAGTMLMRGGVLTSEKTMLYGNAGINIRKFKVTANNYYLQNFGSDTIASIDKTYSSTRVGLALGAGIETYLTKDISFGLDYLYIKYKKLPSITAAADFSLGGALSVEYKPKMNTSAITALINYHF
jgi:opacity protein-like surface antigen